MSRLLHCPIWHSVENIESADTISSDCILGVILYSELGLNLTCNSQSVKQAHPFQQHTSQGGSCKNRGAIGLEGRENIIERVKIGRRIR